MPLEHLKQGGNNRNKTGENIPPVPLWLAATVAFAVAAVISGKASAQQLELLELADSVGGIASQGKFKPGDAPNKALLRFLGMEEDGDADVFETEITVSVGEAGTAHIATTNPPRPLSEINTPENHETQFVETSDGKTRFYKRTGTAMHAIFRQRRDEETTRWIEEEWFGDCSGDFTEDIELSADETKLYINISIGNPFTGYPIIITMERPIDAAPCLRSNIAGDERYDESRPDEARWDLSEFLADKNVYTIAEVRGEDGNLMWLKGLLWEGTPELYYRDGIGLKKREQTEAGEYEDREFEDFDDLDDPNYPVRAQQPDMIWLEIADPNNPDDPSCNKRTLIAVFKRDYRWRGGDPRTGNIRMYLRVMRQVDPACSPDRDGDGITNTEDTAPDSFNAHQYDLDADGIPDIGDEAYNDLANRTELEEGTVLFTSTPPETNDAGEPQLTLGSEFHLSRESAAGPETQLPVHLPTLPENQAYDFTIWGIDGTALLEYIDITTGETVSLELTAADVPITIQTRGGTLRSRGTAVSGVLGEAYEIVIEEEEEPPVEEEPAEDDDVATDDDVAADDDTADDDVMPADDDVEPADDDMEPVGDDGETPAEEEPEEPDEEEPIDEEEPEEPAEPMGNDDIAEEIPTETEEETPVEEADDDEDQEVVIVGPGTNTLDDLVTCNGQPCPGIDTSQPKKPERPKTQTCGCTIADTRTGIANFAPFALAALATRRRSKENRATRWRR